MNNAQRRYDAAVELERATNALREHAAAGRDTTTLRYRLNTAEAVWNAIKVCNRPNSRAVAQ